jgi:hypothetical protein
MKRFIISVLSVSIFFVGLGALVEKTGAKFRSDEKAMALVVKARRAIGGDAALASVQSLRIVGQSTRTIKMDGAEKTIQGETEIALQLPDKIMRSMKIGNDDGTGEKVINKSVDVMVVADGAQKMTVKADGEGTGSGVLKIIIKKDDGTVQEITGAEADKIIAADGGRSGDNVRKIIIKTPDGQVKELTGAEADKIFVQDGPAGNATWATKDDKMVRVEGPQLKLRHADGPGMKQNELLRLTLSLLLTAPQGMDVGYTFGGESTVDGTACNIVVAEFAGSAYKIYLGQSSNLPVMMTYKGTPMPPVMMFRSKDANTPADTKDNMVFTTRVEGPGDLVEYSVKFSDYRSTGGLQLPYRWIQTAAGTADETFDVTSYEINPPNIAEKFQNRKVMIRASKAETQN